MLAYAIKPIYMKTLILLILLIPAFHFENPKCEAQPNEKPASIDWAKTKNWTLYYIKSNKGFSFSLDTLQSFKNVKLEQDSMKTFLQSATDISPDRTPVWMGYYVATCRLPNDSIIKIEISQYGRFFYTEREKHYYQLADAWQDSWLAYLTAKWRVLEGVTE
jgi:hypothetical protein